MRLMGMSKEWMRQTRLMALVTENTSSPQKTHTVPTMGRRRLLLPNILATASILSSNNRCSVRGLSVTARVSTRNVSFKHPLVRGSSSTAQLRTWGEEDSFLQTYKSEAFQPMLPQTSQEFEHLISQLEEQGSTFLEEEEDHSMRQLFNRLSPSARDQMARWNQMSVLERTRLVQKLRAEERASRTVDESILNILYSDEHVCVVCKPSGILAVPGVRRNPSLLQVVYDTFQPPRIQMDQMVVHRLDMDTSGIMVFALSKEALSQLHDDFRNRRVYKSYTALVEGRVCSDHNIQLDLERDPDHIPFMRIARPRHEHSSESATGNRFLDKAPKPSHTDLYVQSYETTLHNQVCTRVQLIPHTGRTHQLRVHTLGIGHPILNDDIYGQPNALPLCLHAHQLAIFHPISKLPMLFECPPAF